MERREIVCLCGLALKSGAGGVFVTVTRAVLARTRPRMPRVFFGRIRAIEISEKKDMVQLFDRAETAQSPGDGGRSGYRGKLDIVGGSEFADVLLEQRAEVLRGFVLESHAF